MNYSSYPPLIEMRGKYTELQVIEAISLRPKSFKEGLITGANTFFFKGNYGTYYYKYVKKYNVVQITLITSEWEKLKNEREAKV